MVPHLKALQTADSLLLKLIRRTESKVQAGIAIGNFKCGKWKRQNWCKSNIISQKPNPVHLVKKTIGDNCCYNTSVTEVLCVSPKEPKITHSKMIPPVKWNNRGQFDTPQFFFNFCMCPSLLLLMIKVMEEHWEDEAHWDYRWVFPNNYFQ